MRTLHPGFTPQQIVCGAGSDDILDMITRLLSPKVILTSTPTFGMYSFLAKVAAARVIDVPRKPHTFDLDVDAIVVSIRENAVPLVFIPSPNNPTGNVMSEDDVRKLCQEKCVVVVDEAYIEFADMPSFADGSLPSEFPNLVVCRTFSKWAGLAGVRVGYAVSTSAKLVEGMMALKQPYNISIPADAAARAALAHREKIMKTVRLLVEEKERLFALLSSPMFAPYLRPVPSKANFVLCEILPSAALSAVEVAQGLRKRGILIRYFGSQGGALQNYIRISSSLPWHTDRVIHALAQLLLPPVPRAVAEIMGDYRIEGILFDMDGVLADVSASYRQAIILTAKYFGVEVSGEDVAKAKAAGDANNDWKLTRRLIEQAKPADQVVPSLDEVTAKFEEYYQGTPENAGLWTTEKLIIDKSLLEKLSAKHPLGIVTGRPRSDARKFLEHYGIGSYFKAVVCMEDTPRPKPDPAPVAHALQQLGVSRAVLIGDTVDDIRAATGAGIKGLGVVAPGGESQIEAEWALLLGAGASLVLGNSLEELLHLLA